MDKLEYNSNLNRDLQKLEKENKIGDLILGQIINAIISISLTFIIVFGITKISKLDMHWVANFIGWICLNVVDGIISFKKKLKKRKEKALKANNNVIKLVNTINNNLNHSKNQSGIISKESIINSVQTYEEYKNIETENYYNINKVNNIVDEIVRDYYMLDNNGKIRVLREIEKRINDKNNKSKEKNNELYLLRDSEIPQPLPVKRVLKEK